MNEIVFEIIKVIVMLVALVIARYLVPWLKEKSELTSWPRQKSG